MGKTFEVNEANFQQDVLGADQPVLVDFWAEWCSPCKMIAPIVDQLSVEYEGKLKVGKMDADANPMIMQQYGVMSIPTLILFKGGQPVARLVGYKPKEQLLEKLEPHLG